MVGERLQGGGDAGDGEDVEVETPELDDESAPSFSDVVFGDADSIAGPPTTPDEEAEDILVEDYNWPEDDADDAVPNGFWESVDRSGDGLAQFGSDAQSGDLDVNVPNPDDLLPDWLPWAVGGTLGTVLLLAVVFIVGQLFTVNVGGGS